MRRLDITGQRFGRLVAKAPFYGDGGAKWKCLCSCGNIKTIRLSELRNGSTMSCGCLQKEIASERIKRERFGLTHGLSKTPEYTTWVLMKMRCHNYNHPRFLDWGGKGIYVCKQWRDDFMEFYKHVGKRPSQHHSIDRIDGRKGYEPGNVRWATKEEQSSNRPNFVRKINFNGNIYNAAELARRFGLTRDCLVWRLDNGWSVEKAVSVPSVS